MTSNAPRERRLMSSAAATTAAVSPETANHSASRNRLNRESSESGRYVDICPLMVASRSSISRCKAAAVKPGGMVASRT